MLQVLRLRNHTIKHKCCKIKMLYVYNYYVFSIEVIVFLFDISVIMFSDVL